MFSAISCFYKSVGHAAGEYNVSRPKSHTAMSKQRKKLFKHSLINLLLTMITSKTSCCKSYSK